ncbi:hypothetical protein BGW39_004805, partial [Mortierella sp. 14UC]
EQNAQAFGTLAASIPIRKIANVIYYASLCGATGTLIIAATSSMVYTAPITQVALFVARYFGRQALVPIVKQ